MAIEYKRLTQKELDFFIQMRIHQLREEGAKEEIDLAPALKDYYERHMADGTFVSWIAVDGESIIATSGMSFVEKPPYLDARAAELDYCPVCLQIRRIEEEVLQKNCCPV